MTLIKTKIGRRSFLKTSASLGGGMLIGFNWFISCKSIQQNHKIPVSEEWFDINGYIKIRTKCEDLNANDYRRGIRCSMETCDC
jgi:hypothetical protein